MTMDPLEGELKRLIIDVFDLEGLEPEQIDSCQPLFGAGLGLDSIDALELGLALKKRYDITIDSDTPEVRKIFSSIANLAEFIRQTKPHS